MSSKTELPPAETRGHLPSVGARGLARQPLWLAAGMMLFVVAFERWALGLPLGVHYVSGTFASHSLLGSLLRVSGILAICGAQLAFFWASFASSRPWRVLYWSGFAIATFVEYGYVRATGTVASSMDFIIASRPENVRYWAFMATANADWWAVVPVLIYGAALAMTPTRSGRHLWRLAIVVVATFAAHVPYVVAGTFGREVGHGDMLSPDRAYVTGTMQAFARSMTMFAWYGLTDRLSQRRQELSYQSDRVPALSLVLVIDESVRADHLSLNGYRRPTTPWLEALERDGRLTNWGAASSTATNSEPSVLALLTGATLPDREHLAFSQPTIFQYAKAMNYRTHLLDGQIDLPRYGLTWDDLHYVDDFRGPKYFGDDDPDTDFRMALSVRDMLSSPEGQFVVVLKRGNHIPYDRNYPRDQSVWAHGRAGTYDHFDRPVAGTKWVDSYDDALRYNVDRFFRSLLQADGGLPRTVVLYTSDHGQPYNPANDYDLRTSTAVPLLMFGDARPSVDTGYRASHHNLFPTLLDLMGFPDAQRPLQYGRSLLNAHDADHDKRVVFQGDLWGVEAFETRDFDALPVRPTVE